MLNLYGRPKVDINGIKCVDATKAVTIHIEPADIKKGNTKNPSACAAAQACMRELNANAAKIHIGRSYLLIDKRWIRFKTSRALRTEIVAFDRGGTFEPGEYT